MHRPLVLALLGLAAAAAPASAAKVTYGSDLSLSAAISESNPQDWMAWPVATTPASAGGYAVSTQGEVATVAFKGTIDAPSGLPSVFAAHVLVLRSQPDGRVKVVVTSRDVAPLLVNRGDNAVTSIDLQQFPERICALPGDVVALATSGGYDAQTYPAGVPVKMFGRAPASATDLYKVPAGGPSLNDGSVATPARSAGVEMLMQVTVGTGNDSRPTCRGSATPTPSPGPGESPTPAPTTEPGSSPVTLPKTASAKVRRKRVKLPVSCAGPSACDGRLALSRKGKAFGSAAFTLPAGVKQKVRVKLNAAGRRALRAVKGGLTVKVAATTSAGLRVTSQTILRRSA